MSDTSSDSSSGSSSDSSSESSSEALCDCAIKPKAAATLLLRLALGMLFFGAGLNKFLGEGGPAGVAQWIIGDFQKTFLPSFLLIPYAYMLPYVETALGFMLIAGIATRSALFVTGLLLISLAFGKLLLRDAQTVATNLNYVFITAVALWFASKDDRYSVGYLLRRKK